MQHVFCQVLKHGDEPSDCESSCPCYYSQIEGLGLHVVNITRYVITIKKHLHNRIESNCKEYESLHPQFLVKRRGDNRWSDLFFLCSDFRPCYSRPPYACSRCTTDFNRERIFSLVSTYFRLLTGMNVHVLISNNHLKPTIWGHLH